MIRRSPRAFQERGSYSTKSYPTQITRSGWRGSADRFPAERLLLRVGFVLRDVLRKFDMGRPGLFRLSEFERLADDLRDDVRVLHAGIPLRDGAEQLQDVDVLMGLPMD